MAVRSTGIGWASGVGRSGAILAPIVIGALVAIALVDHRLSASAHDEHVSAEMPEPSAVG